MRASKFAISVAAETMTHVDRAAKRLGMTRSGYVATILSHVAKQERDASISAKVNEALAAIGEQDLASALHLGRARRDDGTEW